jgi:hypothetical protein
MQMLVSQESLIRNADLESDDEYSLYVPGDNEEVTKQQMTLMTILAV